MSGFETSKSEGIELIYEALDGMAQGIIVHTGEEILYSNSKTIELLEIPAGRMCNPRMYCRLLCCANYQAACDVPCLAYWRAIVAAHSIPR